MSSPTRASGGRSAFEVARAPQAAELTQAVRVPEVVRAAVEAIAHGRRREALNERRVEEPHLAVHARAVRGVLRPVPRGVR